eukprot:Clim_evm6s231 gene=Clim_evmTU6s231
MSFFGGSSNTNTTSEEVQDAAQEFGNYTSYGGSYDSADATLNVPLMPTGNSGLSPYALGAQELQPLFSQGGVDYVFADEYAASQQMGFGQQLCYGTGISYLTGLTIGSFWGLKEGLTRTDIGGTSARLRLNTVLNAITRRGPFVGNSVGVLAMLYNLNDWTIVYFRGGEDDAINTVAAGAGAGAIFKSTAGPRRMLLATAVGAGVATTYAVARYFADGKPLLGPKISKTLGL